MKRMSVELFRKLAATQFVMRCLISITPPIVNTTIEVHVIENPHYMDYRGVADYLGSVYYQCKRMEREGEVIFQQSPLRILTTRRPIDNLNGQIEEVIAGWEPAQNPRVARMWGSSKPVTVCSLKGPDGFKALNNNSLLLLPHCHRLDLLLHQETEKQQNDIRIAGALMSMSRRLAHFTLCQERSLNSLSQALVVA